MKTIINSYCRVYISYACQTNISHYYDRHSIIEYVNTTASVSHAYMVFSLLQITWSIANTQLHGDADYIASIIGCMQGWKINVKYAIMHIYIYIYIYSYTS